jgi:hypothetical protein
LEALRGLVPIGAHALRGQLYFVMAFINDLAETEVGNLHLPIVENNVLRLKIIMNDFLFALVQVLQTTQNLRNYELGLLLRDLLVLLKVEVEVWS